MGTANRNSNMSGGGQGALGVSCSLNTEAGMEIVPAMLTVGSPQLQK